jgi:hypothetical protein
VENGGGNSEMVLSFVSKKEKEKNSEIDLEPRYTSK